MFCQTEEIDLFMTYLFAYLFISRRRTCLHNHVCDTKKPSYSVRKMSSSHPPPILRCSPLPVLSTLLQQTLALLPFSANMFLTWRDSGFAVNSSGKVVDQERWGKKLQLPKGCWAFWVRATLSRHGFPQDSDTSVMRRGNGRQRQKQLASCEILNHILKSICRAPYSWQNKYFCSWLSNYTY